MMIHAVMKMTEMHPYRWSSILIRACLCVFEKAKLQSRAGVLGNCRVTLTFTCYRSGGTPGISSGPHPEGGACTPNGTCTAAVRTVSGRVFLSSPVDYAFEDVAE